MWNDARVPDGGLLAYLVLGLLVGGESSGLPLPGETALIAAAILAHDGSLSITAVIAIAAAAAIIGDNIGFVIGRRVGRRLWTWDGPFHARRLRLLEMGEVFFQRHGVKAVALARFVTGVRVVGAWIAGATHMPWPRFLVANAIGGIAWAVAIGVAGYLAGHAVVTVIERVGVGAGIAVVVVVAGLIFVAARRHRRHVEESMTPPPEPAE